MDLQWSSTKPDHLITWAQDITFYKVERCARSPKKLKNGVIRLSHDKGATVVGKIADYPFAKVVDLYPGTDAEDMIAVGLGNGKVILTSFGTTLVSKEFVPKHARQLNSLQWNSQCPNYLAAGLDKARSDHAVTIWDISSACRHAHGFHSDIRPMNELGLNETAHSLAWAQAKTILVGMNGKHIKLFDLRDSSPKLGSTASTKGVYGINIDSLNPHRVTSFAENQVYVWDMRNFDKPFVVLHHSKPVTKTSWCPTRSGLLASIEKDTNYITLYDVHHATLSIEEADQAVLERRLSPAYTQDVESAKISPLSSFAWHPVEENMVTTGAITGALWNSIVYERVTLNWSPTSKLCWSNGKKLISYIDNTDDVYSTLNDISVRMKHRAYNSYGLLSALKDNSKIVQENSALKWLWEWLDYCKTITECDKSKVPSIGNLKFPGARVVLKVDTSPGIAATPLKSEIINTSMFDVHSHRMYKSEERSFVQKLCGWSLEPSIAHREGSPTRKAAVALFHLKLRHAIKLLNDSNNSVVAMAIAGFTEQKNTLWRDLAHSTCHTLTDPYIKAMFAFLMESDTNNYSSILNEKKLSVADRIGFACSFLPDQKLSQFIHELSVEMRKQGNLDGIMLTGMTPQCIPLLQKYLDMTGDVQTVSLLGIRTMCMDIPSSPSLKLWIDRYRELLDSWKYWEQRAEFDILKNSTNPALTPQPEVNICCNFCGKSISSPGTSSLPRNPHLFSRFATAQPKAKFSCCPSCRKPLPRCAICLLHLGTILGSGEPTMKPGDRGASPEALSWFTWCESCRHGGHTIHITQWFKNQTECPVTGCVCKCITLDKVVDFAIAPKESIPPVKDLSSLIPSLEKVNISSPSVPYEYR